MTREPAVVGKSPEPGTFSKLAAQYDVIKNWWDYNIGMQAPVWVVNIVKKVANHPGTPWFFLGSGIEAFGVTIQFMFLEASYPIADFIVGFALFALVAWWQAGKKKETRGTI